MLGLLSFLVLSERTLSQRNFTPIHFSGFLSLQLLEKMGEKHNLPTEDVPQPDVQAADHDILAHEGLHRRLNNRQVQLLAIGGSIGTALFVSIGNGLAAGGPGSLVVAYTIYSLILACINNCIAEMTVLQPVSGGFIRLAGKWVDDALGFMVGWNFFFYEALLIPFEITALSLVLGFWRDDIPVAAVCAACIVLYA
jgi:amino acid transporter